MSCKNCEENPIETYVRIGNGNVMITGCAKHLRELLEKLRNSKKEEEGGRKKINLYIFDIDGVVADISHRLHYIDEKNYEKFYSDEEIAKDGGIEAGINLVKKAYEQDDSFVVFTTGRPHSTNLATVDWLANHDALLGKYTFYRENGDYRQSPIIKVGEVKQAITEVKETLDRSNRFGKIELELGNIYFIDDDPKNVQAVEEKYPEVTGIVFTTKRMEE